MFGPPVAPEAPESPEGDPGSGDQHVVESPIVGTFYRAPSPEADPFIKVGDAVRTGQVLCIVEAMKLMNEIPCDIDGTVTEIHVEDSEPVGYGQPLFSIRPS